MNKFLHLLRGGVVFKEPCDSIVTVGDKVHLVPDPHRVPILRVLPRNLDNRRIGKLRNPHSCGIASAIATPGYPAQAPRICEWHIRDVASIRRIRSRFSHGQRNFCRQATFKRNGKQSVEARIAVAAGTKKDLLAVWRPSNYLVDRRVMSEPRCDSTL